MSFTCAVASAVVVTPDGIAVHRPVPCATSSAPLLPAATRRRASALTVAFADACAALLHESGCAPDSIATVFASARGETGVLRELMLQLAAGEPALSPIRFSGSVHNAASGQVSIALGNRAFTTSIAAGDETVEMALIEAFGLLATGEPEVLVLVGDDDVPAELTHEPQVQRGANVIALHLHRLPGRQQLMVLRDLVWRPDAGAHSAAITPSHPLDAGWALVAAIADRQVRRLTLASGKGGAWTLDLAEPEATE